MITIVVGLPGQGKTMYLMREAYKALRKGRNVFYNIPEVDTELLIKNASKGREGKKIGRMIHWEDWSDFVRIKRGLILCDEAQTLFNAYDWQSLPKPVQYKLQQHRKDGLDILGAVQNFRRITTVMRELSNFIWEVRCIPKICFIARQYDVADITNKRREAFGVRIFRASKKWADCYDTNKKIGNEIIDEEEEEVIQSLLKKYDTVASNLSISTT